MAQHVTQGLVLAHGQRTVIDTLDVPVPCNVHNVSWGMLPSASFLTRLDVNRLDIFLCEKF